MRGLAKKPPAFKAILAAFAVPMLLASAALAEELTRAEYVERVEPICKSNAEDSARIQKGVKQLIQSNDLVPAGKRIVRASTALGEAVGKIAQVPRPAADATKLARWIGLLRVQQRYLLKIGKALKAKKEGQANNYAVQLNQSNNKANNTVISFGFDECRIDSSKFL